MPALRELATDLRCALDPVAFAVERLKFEPDPWQADVLRLGDKNTLLCCSRQAGKSTTTAIIALHTALYQPGALVLLGSPSQRQSQELFTKIMDFFKALDHRPRLDEDNKTGCTLANGSRIVSLPGTGATVRGYSAPDLVIEDEAAFVADSFNLAVRPMLAVSHGRLILMSTPMGCVGHFYQSWTEGGDDWHRVKVPATECPRITPAFLASERREMGEMWFSQEYMCIFGELMDAVFRMADIERAVTDEVAPLFDNTPLGNDVKPLDIARMT